MPKQRDIVLIPVPYFDLNDVKKRPVLVLSSDSHLHSSPDMVVAAITSNLSAGTIGVIFDTADMEAGSLPRRSLVRADKIYNLSQREILKPYGSLKRVVFDKVLSELDVVLGR